MVITNGNSFKAESSEREHVFFLSSDRDSLFDDEYLFIKKFHDKNGSHRLENIIFRFGHHRTTPIQLHPLLISCRQPM